MNTISLIYLFISSQKLLPAFQHCRSTGKLMTQKQERILEFRYFSSWKKEQIFSLSEQVELKSSRSHIYLYFQNSLCTLPKVTFAPIMWVLRWCSVRGEIGWIREGITLQCSFSGEWSSLVYSSRQCDPVQKWGSADLLYLFSREVVGHRMTSYIFPRHRHSPKSTMMSTEKWKMVPSPRLVIYPVRWESPERDLQSITFLLPIPGGHLSPVFTTPGGQWVCLIESFWKSDFSFQW